MMGCTFNGPRPSQEFEWHRACVTCHAKAGIGQSFSAELLSLPCGTVSKWRKKLALPCLSNTEGQEQYWRRSVQHLRPCLTCHARAQMMPKDSAALIGWAKKSRDHVPRFRRRLGLWMPTQSQINQANAVKLNRQKGSEQWRAAKAIRTQVARIKRAGRAAGDYCEILGASYASAKAHIESKFKDGMNWLNHGAWHIDHIVPIAMFNLTDRSQLLAASHYTNLQPLWARDNLRKGARLDTR